MTDSPENPNRADSSPSVRVAALTHRYGERVALNQVGFEIGGGEIFGFLGPNGGGKTTLFRILSTLLEPDSGRVEIFGCDLARQVTAIRHRLGVVFQAPSLDGKLTVRENMLHQGHLYGLRGKELETRVTGWMKKCGVRDRARDVVETLSGGLKRRVEIAKSLIHGPRLLLLDEPSSGLDPGARRDLWQTLTGLRDDEGVTVLLTTHLMEEAERCDRIGVLHLGELVALDVPQDLRSEIGGDVITATGRNPGELARKISERFGVEAEVFDGVVRFESGEGHRFVPELAAAFPGEIESVTVGRPTLEDVFIHKTGHRLSEDFSE